MSVMLALAAQISFIDLICSLPTGICMFSVGCGECRSPRGGDGGWRPTGEPGASAGASLTFPEHGLRYFSFFDFTAHVTYLLCRSSLTHWFFKH
jgi:hypothetical protein